MVCTTTDHAAEHARTATEQSDDDTADAEHFDHTAIASAAGAFLTNPEPCKINGHGPTSESP